MAKIIVKFGYMNPNKKNRSNFVEYIAKRDGVIKNIHSFGHKPTTTKQKILIEKLLKKFPKMQLHVLYQEYLNKKSIASASEFITHVEEVSMEELSHVDEYVQYIAERPRVVKEGHHGLFSIHNEPLILEHIKVTVKNHPSNIWTAIISLKREDATRLGYDNLELWKALIRSKQNEVARNLKIDPNNFEWYCAFHDEAHHPHVHLVMFAKDGKQGYLNQKSMIQIRSSFAREIFKDEHLHIYKKQTEYRDQLKLASKNVIKQRIDSLNSMVDSDPKIDSMLLELHEELNTLKGKHTYGYLPKPIKKLVDSIVDEVSNTTHVQKLFDLWYEQRNEILSTYTYKKEQIRHLSDLDEFKSIKNMTIKMAKDIRVNMTTPSTILKQETFDTQQSIKKSIVVVEQDPSFTNESIDSVVTSELLNVGKVIEDTPVLNRSKLTPSSIRLLYQISRIFETSMIKRVQNYHADQKILLKIRKQKIALGQHMDDSQKN